MYWLFSSFVPFSFFLLLFLFFFGFALQPAGILAPRPGMELALSNSKSTEPQTLDHQGTLDHLFSGWFHSFHLTICSLSSPPVCVAYNSWLYFLHGHICLHLFFAKTIHNPQIPNKGDQILYLVLYIPGTLDIMIIPWESPGFMPHFLALESPFLRINFFQRLLM